MSKTISLSSLNKTWIFDLDGTIVKHNGYISDGYDTILDGVKQLFDSISPNDYIIILTARKCDYKIMTEKFLKMNNIRFDQIIYNMPMGERILINDKKPSGLLMAHAINVNRNMGIDFIFSVDDNL